MVDATFLLSLRTASVGIRRVGGADDDDGAKATPTPCSPAAHTTTAATSSYTRIRLRRPRVFGYEPIDQALKRSSFDRRTVRGIEATDHQPIGR